LSSKSAY